MDLTSIAAILGIISLVCGILTFVYKVGRVLSARAKAQEARITDLQQELDAQEEILSEIVYFLSQPEEEKGIFHERFALKNIRRKAAERFGSRNTSGFS